MQLLYIEVCLSLLLKTKEISNQSNYLFKPKNLMFIESCPTLISYVFWTDIFWAPMQRIFLETIIVFRYCLKFLSSKSCSYWMKGAFLKIIFASGDGIGEPAVITFLIQPIFSFRFQDDILFWSQLLEGNLFFLDL